ncbi:MAG: NAD-dependent epimerase/dehydratase family protein [Budvicia sp.]|nr:NAD-dependent epimerase/dehydratase family protein [Budvicia sp.]
MDKSNTSKRVMLTGATGFLGRAIFDTLPTGSVRVFARTQPDFDCDFVIGDLTAADKISPKLFAEIDVIIHCAARAHIMHDTMCDPLEAYRSVNTQGTYQLALQAAKAGVKRFIFISTIKVHGESTEADKTFRFSDSCQPTDPYAVSKFEAENQLIQLAAETGMEVVIIRPPLVYGRGVKGNFASIIRLLHRRLPLPLGAINNKRSLVGLDNLVDLIITCIDHPSAANQIFLVSDDHDLSTTDLLRIIAKTNGYSTLLVPIPMSFLLILGKLCGKQSIIDRLCGNLQVDISHTRETLDWAPPFDVVHGLKNIS